MENVMGLNFNNEIQLLKKKRNKNKTPKSKRENKDNNNNSLNETHLEIKEIKIFNNKNSNTSMEIENKEILCDKKDINNSNNLFLFIKKENIFFKTPEYLFMKGKKNPDQFPELEKYNPYYIQRFYFFSLYDKGIQMDQESWYSVTPEEISEYIASIIPNSNNSIILDAFCGCGGNTISLSKKFKSVIANDLYEEKINMTKNNVKIYNCPDNIIYHANDFLKLNLKEEKIDYVFLSPPWGGPEYKNETVYSLKKWITPDIDKIIEKSFKISKNIILYLPRNTDLEELANIIYKYDQENIESLNNTILFDVKYLNSASKIKAILVSYGPKFNKMKIKLVKKYLINSIFHKNSNKINQNKMQKQLDILKIIGYSEFLSNFIKFKELKKDFSGNIFLENLEKYFVENIMDDEEKEEFEKLTKKNKLNEIENKNIFINNEKDKDNFSKEKIECDNDFIDLREVLNEQKFMEAQKDIYF